MYGEAILMAALIVGAAPPVDKLVFAIQNHTGVSKLGRADKWESFVIRNQLGAANFRETKAWQAIKDLAGWEKFRDPRIAALRASLGTFPDPPRDLQVRVRKTLKGDNYRIDNLTFESRPGLLVTANLYRPATPGKAMPGILICHSHHAPKTQGELQDMGAMWARAGCLVLVMDMPGHGERRDHPFGSAVDFSRPYRISRQDYFFRYNLAIGLQTIGDSLMGWMVWDLQRGVDLLLSRPGIDPKKIILLGAVAGGGDPAAVTAALDRRIAAAAPFNFGGPQPETRLPYSGNFNYAGSGSWESTRNLARSARDGFLPWVIVGAIAPRRHVYAHEFAWDEKSDPVWKRLQTIHAWYGHPDYLSSVHGSGSVRGKPPEATHCTNIGRVHRKGIHESLKKWFDIAIPEEKSERRPAAELLCLDKDERPRPIHELAAELGATRAEAMRKHLVGVKPEQRRKELRAAWGKLLGNLEPVVPTFPIYGRLGLLGENVDSALWEIGEEKDGGTSFLLFRPKVQAGDRPPVVVLFGQAPPQTILQGRAHEIALLLRAGSAVAFVDVSGVSNERRGLGRVAGQLQRGRTTAATNLASTALMLGQPRLGARLRELRTAVKALRDYGEFDPKRISLWGDSFAPVNTPDTRVEIPLELPQPPQSEPLGGHLALLCALFEDGIASVHACGGLVSYQSLLDSAFCHVPYDVVVPGALTAGDLADVVASLAPIPVRLERLVDGRNRAVPKKERERVYATARSAYEKAKAGEKLRIDE